MTRRIAWFSAGAASAVAVKLSNPDLIVYCETGREDSDNQRFLEDCEQWFNHEIIKLKSKKYLTTWEVWEKRKYISGISDAPCTQELKIKPRLDFQQHDDVHIFGYTNDASDIRRSEALLENWPDMKAEFPLIEKNITKANCLAIIMDVGIKPPRVYEMGFPNANCIPCCKATSPAYWALVRKFFPGEFQRMAKLSRQLGARLTRINGERRFIDEIPDDFKTTDPIAPECDMLCGLVQQEID